MCVTSGLQDRDHFIAVPGKLLWFVQTGAHGFGQRFGVERFAEKPDVFGVAVEVGAVTAHEDGFQAGFPGLQIFGQFPAGNAARHDDVGEQQVNLIKAGRPRTEGVDAGIFHEDLITVPLEREAEKFTQARLVFNDQDGFTAAAHRLGAWRRPGGHDRLRRGREKNLESRAFAERA